MGSRQTAGGAAAPDDGLRRTRDEAASMLLAMRASRVHTDLPLSALDLILAAAAYVGVLLLRFDGSVPVFYRHLFVAFLPVALVAHLTCNWAWGLYGQIWRHASVAEARRLLLAGATATAALMVIDSIVWRGMPLSVIVLGGGAATCFHSMLRFQSRLFALNRNHDRVPAGIRLLVVGAGSSGASIVREIRRTENMGLDPVAILDDDPRKQGLSLAGVPIVGGIRMLPEVVTRSGISQVLLAIPSAPPEVVQQVAALTGAAGVQLKVLPDVRQLFGNDPSVRDVRDLQIDDLLGRDQVVTDLDTVEALMAGRIVLITGAGGSIGSEICRQVADCRPAKLLMLDHDETHLHDAAAMLKVDAVQLLADIRDESAVEQVFAHYRPEVVFHAAANKHVPLLESHPCEAIKTNVGGTANLVAAAARHGVERFVFVSTDKAVRPSSTMGATKRVGEQLIVANAPDGARWCAVRFGNVLGSRGSVIPTFTRQITAGGPVTVTDPRMTRFFMSVTEAVQLVLQAAAFSEGGEIFMLDMGEAVNIMELAQRMIRLSGREVGTDIAIEVTGVRPGEKLVEELRAPREVAFPTTHPSIVRLFPERLPARRLGAAIEELTARARANDDRGAGELLFVLAGEPQDIDLREFVEVAEQPERAPALTGFEPDGATSIVDFEPGWLADPQH